MSGDSRCVLPWVENGIAELSADESPLSQHVKTLQRYADS